MIAKYKLAACAVAVLTAAPLMSAMAGEIKLGIIAPMTGQQASEGQDMENAIKLAVSDLNAKGGVNGDTITTVTADDACDPQQGVTAASKLVSTGVVGIVGGYCSGAVLPTLKLYGDAGIPFVMVATNSAKLVTANPGNAVMMNSTADAQVATALGLFSKKGVKSVVLVNEGDAYSADLAKMTADQFAAAGGTVAANERVTTGEQDFSALVSNIRSKKPDAVFWTGYHAGAALLTKQLRQGGYKGAIVLGDGANSPEYLTIAGSAAEGVYIFSPPVLDFLPNAAAFKKSYISTYKRDPGAYAAMSYDGAMLMADAIARAKSTDHKAVVKTLRESDYPGLAGDIKFTPQNTLARSNFAVLVVKDKKWTLAE